MVVKLQVVVPFDSVKTVGTSTSYSLTLNSGNTNTALINVDNLKFDYATQNICFLELVVTKLLLH
jgi:hypothetical protein